jgi:hypothetical protein
MRRDGFEEKIQKRELHRMSDNPVLREEMERGEPILPAASQSEFVSLATDFYRTRRRDALAFDGPEQRLLQFFDSDPTKIIPLRFSVRPLDALMVERGFRVLLDGWRIEDPCTMHGGICPRASQMSVQTGIDRWDFVPVDARFYAHGPAGEKLCIELIEDVSSSVPTIEVVVLVTRSLYAFAKDLWPKLMKWTAENHYLRGQKITARGEFLRLDEKDEWNALVLPETIRHVLDANVFNLLRRRDLYRQAGVPLRRGLLLHGPPGTGKTMIGRALAKRADCTFMAVTPSMMESAHDVRGIFEAARRLAPTILFFEDLDLVASDRHVSSHREILGELLAGLDGIDSGEGVITVATTNDLMAIEPALKERPSRFDVVLEVPAFGETERREYLTRWAQSARVAELDLEQLVQLTKGFTGAQLQELTRAAIIEAVDQLVGDDVSALCIDRSHLQSAVDRLKRRATTKPSAGFNHD